MSEVRKPAASTARKKKRKPTGAKAAFIKENAAEGSARSPVPATAASVEPAARPAAIDDRVVTMLWLFGSLGTLTVAITAGFAFGVATAVLVLVGGAFAAVIALFWSSLRTALGETPLASADAFAIGARGAEEEQKRAVLRALKDLEFERSVGKISEADYRVLVTQYRAQAKQLLRTIDEQSAGNRRRAEEIVRERGIGMPTEQGEVTVAAPQEESVDEE